MQAKRSISPGTVFFGSQSGAGPFTGTGTVYNNGDLRPGNSPANVTYGGDLAFSGAASLTLEIGGTKPGSQYDRLTIANALALGGTLDVSLFNSFTPQAGARFDILDWGSLSGTFNTIDLQPLGVATLAWNTGQLYTSGVLAVVPALTGDYNANGFVDAADYVLWRNTLGSTTSLAADGNFNNQIDPNDYDVWRANFGQTLSGSGGGSSNSADATVPEPANLVLLIFAAAAWYLRRCRAA